MSDIVTLTMKPLTFYSRLDESALTRSLEEIDFVNNIRYIDRGIEFDACKSECDWDGFKDLLSLFLRYDGDIIQLKRLVPDDQVKQWFLSPQRDWHERLSK